MVKLGEPWTEGMGGHLMDETGFPYFRAESVKALDPAALAHPCAALLRSSINLGRFHPATFNDHLSKQIQVL